MVWLLCTFYWLWRVCPQPIQSKPLNWSNQSSQSSWKIQFTTAVEFSSEVRPIYINWLSNIISTFASTWTLFSTCAILNRIRNLNQTNLKRTTLTSILNFWPTIRGLQSCMLAAQSHILSLVIRWGHKQQHAHLQPIPRYTNSDSLKRNWPVCYCCHHHRSYCSFIGSHKQPPRT